VKQVQHTWNRIEEVSMLVKRTVLIFIVLAVRLAAGIDPGTEGVARALPEPDAGPAGVKLPYAGRLTDEAGQPVPDGDYDLTFTLYGAVAGGEALWSEVQRGVAVANGEFLITLGGVQPLPADVLDSFPHRWLAVSVRAPAEATFTALAPRQRLDTAVPLSPSAGAACPHDHVGELWVGDPIFGLYLQNNNSSSLAVGLFGVGQTGVKGSSYSQYGVYGESTLGRGVYGESTSGNGVYAQSGGSGNASAALRANATAASCGIAAYLTNDSGCPTLEIDKHGAGGVAIDLQTFDPGSGQDPGHFIIGYDQDVHKMFQIYSNGSMLAASYGTWASDLAEMLPAAEGPEPGDVLVIGPDGKLTRSTEAFQTSVAGVYSTEPGFVGGQPMEGTVEGAIPLAIVGIVPVKVSAENGSIQPGDLLVASSLSGHAMRAGADPPQGSVIGKALEGLAAGAGTIKMLATLQ
jgi:hypothetical protein